MDQPRKLQNLLRRKTRGLLCLFQCEILHELLEFPVPLGVGRDVILIHPALFDEHVCQGVEQAEIALPAHRIPIIRVHGGLGLPGVDDNDLFVGVRVQLHPPPENGVGHHRVGSHEHDGVGQLQVL